jgi:flagellar protein FlaJ
MKRMPIWEIAIRRLDMPTSRFLIFYVGSAAASGFITAALMMILAPNLFFGPIGFILLFLLPVLTGGAAVFYPILEVQRSALQIEKEMHMFITRMGILSLGEIGAQSIFDILRQMTDYGELAAEVQRIETLVDKWHTSLPEAARIVGQQSPSPLWSDFLDRMSFSIEAGQRIDEFMRSEQETIAEKYSTLYDTRLEKVDSLKEIYVALVSAGLFGLVIAGIHLVLFQTGEAGGDLFTILGRMRWLILASLLFVILQVGALFSFRAAIPDDLMFARDEMITPFRRLFFQTWIVSGIVTGILLVGTIVVVILYIDVLMLEWDKYGLILVAVPFTPLLIPAFLQRREEHQVTRRDESYPGFIRALGGTAQARSAEPSATIKALRGIDFGLLDFAIERLEKRLSTRIDSERAWDYFSSETNSDVITRYNRIYIEGAQSSGLPANTADLVSKSVTSQLSLRRRKALSAETMFGTAIGLLIATVASLNVTISIIKQLGSTISGVASRLGATDIDAIASGGAGFGLPVLENNAVIDENIQAFKVTISLLIILKIITLGAISTRLRGGGITSAIGQMVQMTWLAGITSLLVAILMDAALGTFSVSA